MSELVDTKGLADALRVSPDAVRRWVREGRITPAVGSPSGNGKRSAFNFRFDVRDVRREMSGAGGAKI